MALTEGEMRSLDNLLAKGNNYPYQMPLRYALEDCYLQELNWTEIWLVIARDYDIDLSYHIYNYVADYMLKRTRRINIRFGNNRG